MTIGSIRNRRLQRFVENNDARGLPPEHVAKIRRVITAMVAAPSVEQIAGPPGWRIHPLPGTGRWSVTVSANWRITFAVDGGNIDALDYEDYH